MTNVLSDQEIKDLVTTSSPKEVDQGALKERASKKRVFLMGSAVMDSEELLFRIMLLQWMDYEVVLEEAGIDEDLHNAYNKNFVKTYLLDLCKCDYVIVSVNRVPKIVVDAYCSAIDAINIISWSYNDFVEQVAKKVYGEIFDMATIEGK